MHPSQKMKGLTCIVEPSVTILQPPAVHKSASPGSQPQRISNFVFRGFEDFLDQEGFFIRRFRQREQVSSRAADAFGCFPVHLKSAASYARSLLVLLTGAPLQAGSTPASNNDPRSGSNSCHCISSASGSASGRPCRQSDDNPCTRGYGR